MNAALAEPRRLAIALGSAALAGATDVYGYTELVNRFVSFMSGNTSVLAIALGRGQWRQAAVLAGIVGLFVTGAALGAGLAALAGRRACFAVLLVVGLVLSAPLVWRPLAVPAFLLSMGALNASQTRLGGSVIGLTYVTGALTKFGQGLGRALFRREQEDGWRLHFFIWLSLLTGAVGAALVQGSPETAPLWPLPCLAMALAAAAWTL